MFVFYNFFFDLSKLAFLFFLMRSFLKIIFNYILNLSKSKSENWNSVLYKWVPSTNHKLIAWMYFIFKYTKRAMHVIYSGFREKPLLVPFFCWFAYVSPFRALFSLLLLATFREFSRFLEKLPLVVWAKSNFFGPAISYKEAFQADLHYIQKRFCKEYPRTAFLGKVCEGYLVFNISFIFVSYLFSVSGSGFKRIFFLKLYYCQWVFS